MSRDLGAMRDDIAICAFCPKLCRHVCPVAVGTARESTTPTAMMTMVLLAIDGRVSHEEGLAGAALCTRCGACTRSCALERPVPDLLALARGAWASPPTPGLGLVEGTGTHIAIECDDRRWAPHLARRLGVPVASFRTPDHMGASLLDFPDDFAAHARAIRDRLAGRTIVVACQACERVARDAGLDTLHLATLVAGMDTARVHHPCGGPRLEGTPLPDALACCGAAEPFAGSHPQLAEELGTWWRGRCGSEPFTTPDARCRGAFVRAGIRALDPIDSLAEM